MLYLEDYLEMIENLPMEMRERFTDMREADLETANMVDTLDDKVAHFFKRCVQSNVKKEWRDEQFNRIKEEYIKAIEHSNEKISIANQVYDVVDRHVRKLDTELSKFKMELEADHAGITELLEKRSLELDNVPKENNPPPKRKYAAQYNVPEKKYKYDVHTTVVHSPVGNHDVYSHHSTNTQYAQPAQQSTSNSQYNLVGASAQSHPALRAAASQAIAATQQNMHAGRRSTSLKASIELTRANDSWAKLDSSHASSTAADQAQTSRSQRVKKLSHKAEELMKSQQAKRQVSTGQQKEEVKSPAGSDLPTVIDDSQTSGEWNYDPNEPRYCLCNQVSYGEMIGCDNNDCPLEWFHYGCVGLTSAPKGKWYCPQCRANMKGRKGRN